MSSPDPVMRLLRLITHFNIGATLATAAWVLWSGAQIATGQLAPSHRPDEVRQLMQARQRAAEPGPPMRLTPVSGVAEAQAAAMAQCHPPTGSRGARATSPSEADL